MFETLNYLTIQQASEWASDYIGKNVTVSNVAYLVQYGLVKRVVENGLPQIRKQELQTYYDKFLTSRETYFKQNLGEDLNWTLSFEQYKEAETTKHVHRLHPYKGKFIPQLVEYFLDSHTDKFKTSTYFKPDDIVLDPFSGSGTTMVQGCELGINVVGIDISAFNTLMGNCKILKYDLNDVQTEIKHITDTLNNFIATSHINQFENDLLQELNIFNGTHFPVPDYKYRLRQCEIDEKKYALQKEKDFLPIYEQLINQYNIHTKQDKIDSFLDKWYFPNVLNEINCAFEEIKKIQNTNTKKIVSIILSRTIRSCRATTHADLATLVEPITTTYYCKKHGKICKPLFSILKWWKTYSADTIKRLNEFDKLRTNTFQLCLTGDSRNIDIFAEVNKRNLIFGNLIEQQKIKGIFSSPPYVGLIDYHEQHAYAYDLFGFHRNDELEIGALSNGQTKLAQKNYVAGISQVLINSKHFLADNYDIFLVANDKYNLYPTIAESAGMQIVNQFRRPVLNRTEKDKGAYSETIFHLKSL